MDTRTAAARWSSAAHRATSFLRSRQLPSGEINARVVGSGDAIKTMFWLAGGEDVWHTVNALLAFQATCEATSDAAARYVSGMELEGGGLANWSGGPGLCIETTAAAALVLPALRPSLLGALRRHALPGGRWATFLGLKTSTFDLYGCGPSVTAWALTALGSDDPLVPAGRRHLAESLGVGGTWPAHELGYATPFYPAHLAARWVNDRRVVQYCVDTVDQSSGWGFGDPPDSSPSVLPTAWGILTLLACSPEAGTAMERERREVILRAAGWLMATQRSDGSFALEPIPEAVWYTNSVYATSVAALALARAAEAVSPTRRAAMQPQPGAPSATSD